MNGWKPIETAPRNGMRVLLYWRTCHGMSFTGRYTYDEKTDREGWRCDGDQVIPRNQDDCTHWMPLPEPPKP